MLAIILALLAAVAYGTSDFAGGVLSGRLPPWTVALWAQLTGTLAVLVAAGVDGSLGGSTGLGWAVVSGVGGAAGTAFLYRGLSAGRMGVVAPVSGVGAAVVPVLAGVLGGERPALVAWVGIVLALPAIWLVAREPADRRDGRDGSNATAVGLVDGVVAGLGFGVSYAALGQVPHAAGTWPVAVSLATATVLLLGVVAVIRQPLLPRGHRAWAPAVPGLLLAVATVSFLLATQQGLLSIVGVINALYPAFTVVLAATVLHERIHLWQGLGLGLCAGAVGLVALG